MNGRECHVISGSKVKKKNFLGLTMSFKMNLVTNVPSLTKALVSTLFCVSVGCYVYIYRTSLDEPKQIVCPFIGLVPGL